MIKLPWKRRSTSVNEQLDKLAKMKRGESIQEWLERVDVEIPKIIASG